MKRWLLISAAFAALGWLLWPRSGEKFPVAAAPRPEQRTPSPAVPPPPAAQRPRPPGPRLAPPPAPVEPQTRSSEDDALVSQARAMGETPEGRAQAERLLRRALRINPDNPTALGELLAEYAEQQDFASGNRLIEDLTARRREKSPVFDLQLGRFFIEQGKTKEALASYERAAQDPNLKEWATAGMAETYSIAGDPVKASETYRGLVTGIESRIEATRRQGAATAQAEQELVQAQLGLASALVAKRDFAEAEKVLEAVAKKDPNNVEVPQIRQWLTQESQGRPMEPESQHDPDPGPGPGMGNGNGRGNGNGAAPGPGTGRG